jgi:CspA family cold shock protein
MLPGAATRGGVREFYPDEGCGVIDGPDVPGGCWVSFASIVEDGHRRLTAGQDVSFRATPADQDGYRVPRGEGLAGRRRTGRLPA